MKNVFLKVKISVPDDYQIEEPEWLLEDLEDRHSNINLEDVTILKEENYKDNIVISKEIAEIICKYCEDKAIYDKLGNYKDFYYKIKSKLNNF